MDLERRDDFSWLAYRMECGVALLSVIREVMEKGVFDSGEYARSLFAAKEYLSVLVEEFRRMTAS